MEKLIFRAIVFSIFFLHSLPLPACSGIYISTSKVKLFGLNEDFYNYNTIYRTLPGTDSTYGIIGFGHSNSIQAIINEKGLIYDGYGAPEKPVTRNKDLPVNNGSFIFQAMISCVTVEEVIELYDKYYHPWLSNGQAFFADSYGNSIIIEGDEIIHKTKDYQICTNFYQSDPESGIPYGFYPCRRYNLIQSELENADDYSLDLVKRLLDSVHVENQKCPNGLNSTVYSLIIDLNADEIHVFNLHDFEHEIVLNIKEELNKGIQSSTLKLLFGTSTAEFKEPSKEVLLNQNYPNPFNQLTNITYQVANSTHVLIKIYDIIGDEVETLEDSIMPSGIHRVNWDGTLFSSGVFFCFLFTGIGVKEVIKMMLLK